MILAGLQNSSLIDYPGKVACVAFLTGCNFTCPYCHNPELARGRFPQRIALDRFLAFLSQRRLLLDGVVVSGGEPTLNPDLPALRRAVKKLGLPVKL
ncbi:MAG: 4Fe-4S cluster-binding domain-containing protein, partial [Desulfatitalea sp.]|nr:4Fe-4S cluster-binding domain-containing protein [Desulfatitalea sp.]NNK02404.1 4Fe-4S cluster-binding domain-containing protein [Desulfatitalea sp.]